MGDRPHAGPGADRCRRQAPQTVNHLVHRLRHQRDHRVAVTPVHPSRESVLAALRSAVLREKPYGPFGGLPEKVRVDRGKDLLSRTVTAAFAVNTQPECDSTTPRHTVRHNNVTTPGTGLFAQLPD